MRRRKLSLLQSIALWLTAVMLAAVAASGLLMYWQFESTNILSREQTLRGQAALLAQAVHLDATGAVQVDLPPQTLALFDATASHYAVIDGQGRLLASSEGISQPLWLPMMQAVSQAKEFGFWPFRRRSSDEVFFINRGLEGPRPHYGVSRTVRLEGHKLLVQVASTDEELRVDTEIEEYIDHVGWFWIPFILLLLTVNLVVIHRGLRPLRLASQMAGRIGPDVLSERLPVEAMPREIVPLVEAVNRAFDRIEAGYNAQRDFLADVTHELRTPLSILKAQLSILDDQAIAKTLLGDLDQLERLVAQLLDIARLDVLRVGCQDECDLEALAREIAEYLAPLALDRGRSIELVSLGHPVLVRGVYDYLFRALRNLMENAIAHTPPGTMVRISVIAPASIIVEDGGPGIPEEQRQVIFERFWQGRRDRKAGKTGAGLGMAIVARTLKEHGGRVEIGDSDLGGAKFTLVFSLAKPMS